MRIGMVNFLTGFFQNFVCFFVLDADVRTFFFFCAFFVVVHSIISIYILDKYDFCSCHHFYNVSSFNHKAEMPSH